MSTVVADHMSAVVADHMSAVVADHTSDDSYIYQLSLVLATATISFN